MPSAVSRSARRPLSDPGHLLLAAFQRTPEFCELDFQLLDCRGRFGLTAL